MASFFTRTKSFSKPSRDRVDTTSSPTISAPSPVLDPAALAAAKPSGNVLANAYSSMFGSRNAAAQQQQTQQGGGRKGAVARTTVEDPVSMHLLMETALMEAGDYTVLSPEEADETRRQLERTTSRTEQLRRKLAMEMKVQEASKGLIRLDQAQAASNGQPMKGLTSEEEQREAEKRCNALGKELWDSEQEQTTLRRKLLEHTAGVLQLTHKGYTKDMSVASLTTASTLPDEDFEDFDVKSAFYKPYEGSFSDGIIDLDLGSGGGGGGGGGGGAGAEVRKQAQIIEEVEEKIERLNANLRDLVSRMDFNAQLPPLAPSLHDNPNSNAVDVLPAQISALEQAAVAMQQVQARRQASDDAAEEQLHGVNRQIYEAVTGDTTGAGSPAYPAPPQDADIPDQISYLSGGVDKLKHLVGQMGASVSSSGPKLENLDQYDSTLQGLWDLLSADERGMGAFSIQSFSDRVQTLHKQGMALQQQKEVLTRQIQQQRELNASSDEVKDKRIADMSEEMHTLRGAADSHTAHTADLEADVVRLQTELTMARAELDGAYGSRAQRAAEAAADPVLTGRIAALEKELSETIADYENMTKAELEHERERESLEASVDRLRDQVERLEVQLSEEKIGLLAGGLGNRTPATPATDASAGGTVKGGTSAGVLKAEFKRMMRETRAEHAKKLKDEQDERRRLEGVLRAIKKEQLSKAPSQAASPAAVAEPAAA